MRWRIHYDATGKMNKRSKYYFTVNAPTEQEARKQCKYRFGWDLSWIISIKPDHLYEHREAYHKLWAKVWEQALNNTPEVKGRTRGGELIRYLGYKLYSKGGHYIAHYIWYHGITQGVRPADPTMRRRLTKRAGIAAN